jgi:hypothetical protein
MVEYLRKRLSESKPGDKYGKLLQPLSNHWHTLILSMLEVWWVFFCRKLCPPVCRWFYIHWPCKFLQRVHSYIIFILFFNSRWNHNSNFDYLNVQVDGSVVSKQGVRFVFTDGSRIIYRLSVSEIYLFRHCPFQRLFVKLNITWLPTMFCFIGNGFCWCNC